MKAEDIYKDGLNLERISAYKELAKEYRIRASTVREIFSKGAEWGVGVVEREKAFPKYYPVLPDVCEHQKEWLSYYDGGSVWCNNCHSYINLPSENEKRYFKYRDGWYEKGDKIRIKWFKYQITFVGIDGTATVWRRGNYKTITGDVAVYLKKELTKNK